MNSIILIAVCLTNPPLRDVLYISATHKQLYLLPALSKQKLYRVLNRVRMKILPYVYHMHPCCAKKARLRNSETLVSAMIVPHTNTVVFFPLIYTLSFD